MKKEVLLLGCSGSIGTQTLDVIRAHPDRFSVLGLSCRGDAETLYAQANEFRPRFVGAEVPLDKSRLPEGTVVFSGTDASTRLAQEADADVTVLAISGYAALSPLLAAISHGKRIAIANKESLVCGGSLVDEALRRFGASADRQRAERDLSMPAERETGRGQTPHPDRFRRAVLPENA